MKKASWIKTVKAKRWLIKAGLFSFLFLVNTIASAQTVWAPIGAKWVNEKHDIEQGLYYLITFESVKDTLVLEKNCKKIQKFVWCQTGEFYVHPCNTKKDSSIFFIYSENDKVYYSKGDSFILMYDFSLKAGDTFGIYQQSKYYENSFKFNRYRIIKTDSVQISGKYLKRQDVYPLDYRYDYYFYVGYNIERIGNTHSIFGTFTDSDDSWGPPYLKCYSDNDIFYQDTHYVNCNGFEGISDVSKPPEFRLYPNPATNELILNYSGHQHYNLQIVNSLGIVMKEQPNLINEINTIDLGSFTNGIYFMILTTDNSRLVKKFIKN